MSNTTLVTWNSFKDCAPTLTEEYLVCDISKPEAGVTVLSYNAEHGAWLMEIGLPFPMPIMVGKEIDLTHWAALPSLPTL